MTTKFEWANDTARYCSYIANGCSFQCAYGGKTLDEALDIVCTRGLAQAREDAKIGQRRPLSPEILHSIEMTISTCTAVLDGTVIDPAIGNVRDYARYLITHSH